MSDEIIGTAMCATGFIEKIDNFTDRIPEYDPRSGNHFWVTITIYQVNPELESEQLLDHESIVSITGPGCYYCETVYTKLLASRRCPGEPK